MNFLPFVSLLAASLAILNHGWSLVEKLTPVVLKRRKH
jgi:hypothetical protein